MSQMTTTATLDQVPNPQAAQALAQFFGKLRSELVDQGFTVTQAEQLVVNNSRYIFESASVTITGEVSA